MQEKYVSYGLNKNMKFYCQPGDGAQNVFLMVLSAVFPSPAGMSLTKLSLAGINLIIPAPVVQRCVQIRALLGLAVLLPV
jgi:hypothetical protein